MTGLIMCMAVSGWHSTMPTPFAPTIPSTNPNLLCMLSFGVVDIWLHVYVLGGERSYWLIIFTFQLKKMASNQCNNGCGSYLSFVNYEYVNITCIFVKALHFLRLNVLSDVEPALCLWSDQVQAPTPLGEGKDKIMFWLNIWSPQKGLLEHLRWFHIDKCRNIVLNWRGGLLTCKSTTFLSTTWYENLFINMWCGMLCRNINNLSLKCPSVNISVDCMNANRQLFILSDCSSGNQCQMISFVLEVGKLVRWHFGIPYLKLTLRLNTL